MSLGKKLLEAKKMRERGKAVSEADRESRMFTIERKAIEDWINESKVNVQNSVDCGVAYIPASTRGCSDLSYNLLGGFTGCRITKSPFKNTEVERSHSCVWDDFKKWCIKNDLTPMVKYCHSGDGMHSWFILTFKEV